jgi:hypothetical protein
MGELSVSGRRSELAASRQWRRLTTPKREDVSTAEEEPIPARPRSCEGREDHFGCSPAEVREKFGTTVVNLRRAVDDANTSNGAAAVGYPLAATTIRDSAKRMAKVYVADVIEEKTGKRPSTQSLQPGVTMGRQRPGHGSFSCKKLRRSSELVELLAFEHIAIGAANGRLSTIGSTPRLGRRSWESGRQVSAMISYAFVDGFTRVARDEAIERLKQAIATADGVIVDFAFFGQEAIRLTVELDAGALATLRHALEAGEVELFSRCVAEMDDAKSMNATHPILAMLHVTFVPAEADTEHHRLAS